MGDAPAGRARHVRRQGRMNPQAFDVYLLDFLNACHRAVQPITDVSAAFYTSLFFVAIMVTSWRVMTGNHDGRSAGDLVFWFFRLWLFGYLAQHAWLILESLMYGAI